MLELHMDLIGFVDGELSDARADEIREHLRTCEVCAALLCEELLLTARLSTLPGNGALGQAVPLSDTGDPTPREHLAFSSLLAPSS